MEIRPKMSRLALRFHPQGENSSHSVPLSIGKSVDQYVCLSVRHQRALLPVYQ